MYKVLNYKDLIGFENLLGLRQTVRYQLKNKTYFFVIYIDSFLKKIYIQNIIQHQSSTPITTIIILFKEKMLNKKANGYG